MNDIAKALLQDLQNDLNYLKTLGSNVDVIHELEKLHNHNILIASANLIRKSLK